jgi:hypothetical protein
MKFIDLIKEERVEKGPKMVERAKKIFKAFQKGEFTQEAYTSNYHIKYKINSVSKILEPEYSWWLHNDDVQIVFKLDIRDYPEDTPVSLYPKELPMKIDIYRQSRTDSTDKGEYSPTSLAGYKIFFQSVIDHLNKKLQPFHIFVTCEYN